MDTALLVDWILALATLTALEIILGIDNIVLISIVVEKLPPAQRPKARKLGLGAALLFRILLLSTITWLTRLQADLFWIMGKGISVRDIILIVGGLFLLAKATIEIFRSVEGEGHEVEIQTKGIKSKFAQVIFQIILFDLIFSIDSVLTAVGLVSQLEIMVAAVILSIIFMIIFVDTIGEFVQKNPSIKILALAFLVMIGVLLVAEGFDSHFDRGYVYFAMAFSLVIELLSRRQAKKALATKKRAHK